MKMLQILIFIFAVSPIGAIGQSKILAQVLINDLGQINYSEESKKILVQLELLSFEELSSMMEDGNSLEKVYAFWAYSKKEGADYRKYFPRLVRDTAKVKHTQIGCRVFGPKEVGSHIFDIAENRSGRCGEYKIYPNFLDSMALELESYKGIRGNINCRLMNLDAPEHLYEKLLDKARQGDVPAIMGVANYKKEKDIILIKEHLKPKVQSILYGLMCVEKFPHKDFEEDVLRIYYSKMDLKYPIIFNYVCQVLRKYDSPKVEKAFDELISNPDKYYFQIIGLWHSFEKEKEYDHPLRKRLIAELGMEEIEKRLAEYKEMNYWVVANQNKNLKIE